MAVYKIEPIDESVADGVSKVESYAELFYEHCLKWANQISYQGSSWSDTILKTSKHIKSIVSKNTNVYNGSELILAKCYKKAFAKAKIATSMDISDNGVWSNFNTVGKIIDEQHVRDWANSFLGEGKPPYIDNKKILNGKEM